MELSCVICTQIVQETWSKPGEKLDEQSGEPLQDVGSCRWLVGQLISLSYQARHAYTVSVVSQHMNSPRTLYLEAAFWVYSVLDLHLVWDFYLEEMDL